MEKKKFWNDLPLLVIASLTLGLAPFIPEPHIWGKIKWKAGGAHGMQLMDWLDFAMHGIPWVLLFRVLILKSIKSAKNPESD